MFTSLRFEGEGTSLKSGRDHFNFGLHLQTVTDWISKFFNR